MKLVWMQCCNQIAQIAINLYVANLARCMLQIFSLKLAEIPMEGVSHKLVTVVV
jgi:hypothetical protein